MAGARRGKRHVMNGKQLIIVLAGIVILTGCQQAGEQEAAVPSELQVITFADSMIEQETRKILNKPAGEITEEEVLTITEFGQWERDGVLELFEGEVTTLSDLKWFKNLNLASKKNKKKRLSEMEHSIRTAVFYRYCFIFSTNHADCSMHIPLPPRRLRKERSILPAYPPAAAFFADSPVLSAEKPTR